MALNGTLKDFGIADILQLIGQQQKTGLLHLRAKEQEVVVGFASGNIVKAESTTRNKKDLIGAMLVRAQLITEPQLEVALETQKRTLQRLGDVLVDMGVITVDKFKKLVHLQTTETLYRLFSWKSGSYEFEQKEFEYDASAFSPLRPESVLMEGFRIVDEWPVVKRVVTSYQLTFERHKELPPPSLATEDLDDALGDAFGDGPSGGAGDRGSVGNVERTLHGLVVPGRDVRKLIDLSCVGEFEACKGLSNLVSQGYLKVVPAVGVTEEVAVGEGVLNRAGGVVGRVVATMVVLAGVGFLLSRLDSGALHIASQAASAYSDPAGERVVSVQQMSRIQRALEVYVAERGELPDRLEQLVETRLLSPRDLSYPWKDTYYYRRAEGHTFVLLPPLR